MKTIQRIAVALVAILLAGGLFAAPAQADEPKEPVPADCTVYTSPIVDRAASMQTELRAVYAQRDQFEFMFTQQRERAEAFKAQVVRKNDKIARLRALLEAARN